jgi:hypothetical protein
MKLGLIVVFMITVLPLLVIMIGVALWTDAKAKELDLETNED